MADVSASLRAVKSHQPRGIVCHQTEEIAAATLSSAPNDVRSAGTHGGWGAL